MRKIIAIEGTDGTGKQTQADLLRQYFEKRGDKVFQVSFPNYENPSSSLVKAYLSGEFGEDPAMIPPKIASTFYSVDRYATVYGEKKEIFSDPDAVIILDRYVGSNAIHQGSKCKSESDLFELLAWLRMFEFGTMQLPTPNWTFWLDVPPEISANLTKDRKNKFSGDSKKDIHEKNLAYMRQCYETGCKVADIWHWRKIHCVNNNNLLSVGEISKKMIQIIENEEKFQAKIQQIVC